MTEREKQIVAIRTAWIAGVFSLIVGIIMLLNYWQLKTTDPLESEALKALVERLQDDNTNDALKVEIRNLDLMSRNAFFTKQWQIESGAWILIAGIVIMVISLRIYYSSGALISEPQSKESSLDIELMISRRWILYTVFILFGSALIASWFTIDHLSETYNLTETKVAKDEVPIQQIVPAGAEVQSEPTVAEQETTIADAAQADTPVENTTRAEPAKTTVADYRQQFPSFRGPNGLGISSHKNIPVSWDGTSGNNIMWKVKIPLHGFNSPVVWENYLFVTGADKSNQSVYCYDATTGKLVWEHKVTGIERPAGKPIKPTEETGYAAPTVATDGLGIYAIFATGDLVCIDFQGKSLWSKNIGIPDNHYGHSSSLLLWKNRVIIQFDTNSAGKLLALDSSDGSQLWETPRTSKISWASPIIATIGGRDQIVLAATPKVAGYDPENGKELWSVDCLSGEVGPSPAYSNGVIYAANEYAKLIGIKPGTPPETVWESNEYLPDVASPVAMNGSLFIATSYGIAACFDAVSGELLWEHESQAGFYASPVIADGKVYFLDMDGKMHIFSMAKEKNLLGEPELGEKAVSTPAFANGKIFLRGFDHLFCIGK
ncbi:MAG: PQQ-binding-like beta-propeller repeat protein [Cyclobacteriaceae bacterium]|nr:PQQ-binding-like beta-propeller repeat protein [Cyclobacteriaceae bacterium]